MTRNPSPDDTARTTGRITGPLADVDGGDSWDVVVVGAGAAGLTAALVARLAGARVLVVERTGQVGGTSALTAGTLWVPGALADDPAGDVARAARYLDDVLGPDTSAAQRRRFLAEGAGVVAELQARTRVAFVRRERHPDYLGSSPYASAAGHAIEAADFDGRVLGPDLDAVHRPLREFTILGGLAPSRLEAASYAVIARRPLTPAAWSAALRAVPRVARHVLDRAARRRPSHLTMGNALVGRLLASLRELDGVRIALGTHPVDLERDATGVVGVTVTDGRTTRRLGVRGGVLVATGGFTRGARRHDLLGTPIEWSAVSAGADGSVHDLLERVGATFGRQGSDAFWAPVSLVPSGDGTSGIYPHFALDRAKPGVILVDRHGRRFVSEAAPYQLVGEAMIGHPDGAAGPFHLIGDRDAVARYGLGVVRPGRWGRRRRRRDGYLVEGRTLAELAAALGLPAGSLEATVERVNGFAERGVDADFGRGSDAYQANLGDPAHRPNPSLGPLRRGPFAAIRLYPGDIGSASGFVADDTARALTADGTPVGGLYVLGSDMHSILGGRYPGPGITLGPAVVFAALAARDAARRARDVSALAGGTGRAAGGTR